PGSSEAGLDWRRYLEVRGAQAGGPSPSAAQVRAVSWVRARGDARRDVPPGGRVRVPFALRGLRAPAARGDGQRNAGGHVERLLTSGSRGRRCAARRSLRSGGHRRGDSEGADRCRRATRAAAEGARAGPGVLVGGLCPAGPGDLSAGRRERVGFMKIALVHDWLTGMRGGERVLEVLCERFPTAELFTLVHVRGSVSPIIERRIIHTSPLQRLPRIGSHYRH